MEKPKCKRCGKEIVGKIRIISYRKKLGKKSLLIVDKYDDNCFRIKKKEKALDEPCKQKRNCKKKTTRRT